MPQIKPQTVIPPGVKITKCPPGVGKARSVYSMERQHERQLEKKAEAERQQARFKQLREQGFSIADAARLAME